MSQCGHQRMVLDGSTVHGHFKVFVTFEFLLYISNKTTFFQKNITGQIFMKFISRHA